MGKYKDYVFQHQKRRFRLRVYSYGLAAKIFMDDQLRDIGMSDGLTKTVLDFFFRDDRKQEHRIHIDRKSHWFKYHYTVYWDGVAIYKTRENEPS